MDMPRTFITSREREVWERLHTVTDPELDEPVTDLQFVSRADVDAKDCVHIDFRLPTYWCAANFSFLMADDMRRAVQDLPWVKAVNVTLGEHMYANKINAGLKKGLSFQETFGDEADGDLDTLRQQFLVKAFQRRQEALLGYLVGVGHSAEALTSLTLAGLDALDLDDEGAGLRSRYHERRHVAGPIAPAGFAFVDADGDMLQAETLSAYLRALRRIGVNAEFNGALCKGLLAVRFDIETPFIPRHIAERQMTASAAS